VQLVVRVLFAHLLRADTLSHLWPEVVPVILNLVLSFPLGLSSLLILCIDLGTELLPAISLSYEKPEVCSLTHSPHYHSRRSPTLSPGLASPVNCAASLDRS
jgi:hypothetical protein